MSTRRMSIKKLKHLNFFKQVPQLNSIFLISTRWRAHEKIYELYTYEACFNFFLFGVKSRIMFVDEFHLKCFDNNFNFSLTSELVSAKTEARRIIEIFYRQRANFASTSFYGSLLLFLRLNIPFYCMSFFFDDESFPRKLIFTYYSEAIRPVPSLERLESWNATNFHVLWELREVLVFGEEILFKWKISHHFRSSKISRDTYLQVSK